MKMNLLRRLLSFLTRLLRMALGVDVAKSEPVRPVCAVAEEIADELGPRDLVIERHFAQQAERMRHEGWVPLKPGSILLLAPAHVRRFPWDPHFHWNEQRETILTEEMADDGWRMVSLRGAIPFFIYRPIHAQAA